MSPMWDAAWRAFLYCLHPRVVVLSFLPLVLMLALAVVFGYWLWDPALQALSEGLQSAELLQALLNWLGVLGLDALRTAFALCCWWCSSRRWWWCCACSWCYCS